MRGKAGKRGLPSSSGIQFDGKGRILFPSKLIEKEGMLEKKISSNISRKMDPWNRGNRQCVSLYYLQRASLPPLPRKKRNFEVIGIVPYLLREEARPAFR